MLSVFWFSFKIFKNFLVIFIYLNYIFLKHKPTKPSCIEAGNYTFYKIGIS
jgi:hypothetical protein